MLDHAIFATLAPYVRRFPYVEALGPFAADIAFPE
jgi:hypothetical protein